MNVNLHNNFGAWYECTSPIVNVNIGNGNVRNPIFLTNYIIINT